MPFGWLRSSLLNVSFFHLFDWCIELNRFLSANQKAFRFCSACAELGNAVRFGRKIESFEGKRGQAGAR
jgi:hypothetical protein